MKNVIFVDFDSDRERPVAFGKPPDFKRPETPEETKEMVINDIACLTSAIASLILTADFHNYGEKRHLVQSCIESLTSILTVEDEFKAKNQGESEKNN
jgi:hypothetical protein